MFGSSVGRLSRLAAALGAVALSAAAFAQPPADSAPIVPLPYTGVNLSGGEFGDAKPGVTSAFNKNYTYPVPRELDYFAGKGVNIIRLPFRWPRLQRSLNQPLDATELGRIRSVVDAATSRGMTVVLDPHDYARYYGKVIGGPDVSDADFAAFWSQLATAFKDNPRVWFGLMNEPHDLPKEQWLAAANSAIAAIRAAGAANMILVPGIAWTGAHSWISSGNGETMAKIVDPRNHYAIEAHQYLDSDSSGTKPTAVSATIGSERLASFTDWCRDHHVKALLGEFGAADNPTSAAATEDTLRYMEKNRDVWLGFTWWSAGPWWGDYMFTLEPKDGKDRPQMAIVGPHLQKVPVH